MLNQLMRLDEFEWQLTLLVQYATIAGQFSMALEALQEAKDEGFGKR